MKKYLAYSLLLLLIGCQSEDPIIGTWERIGDNLKGMKIKVEKNSYSYYGELIKQPENGDTTFYVGDVKWKDIKNVGKNKYVLQDLGKYKITFGSLFQNHYMETNLTLENDVIKTRVFAKGNESMGTEQTWKRSKE